MSLNRREIDLILSEWQFSGARVQEIYQPSIQSLYMELYVQGAVQRVHVYLSQGAVRLHKSEKKLAKPKKPQRFQQLLQSKIVGAYVQSIVHVNDNRIVRIHLARKVRQEGENNKENNEQLWERYLYCKLWSNNVNIVYTDVQNTIIDLLYRSPKQKLMPQERFNLPQNSPSEADSARTVRNWSGTSFNQYVESYYQKQHEHATKKALLKKARATLEKRILYLHTTCVSLEAQIKNKDNADLYTEYGKMLLAHAHEITLGDSELRISGAGERGDVVIALEATQSATENAQRYFEKAKKARGALENTRARYHACLAELEHAKALALLLPECAEDENSLENEDIIIPERVLEYVRQHQVVASGQAETKQEKKQRGIFLRKDSFSIAIGRNAMESDALLRHYARGEDIWMHVLGMKGGFVFLRCPRASSKTKGAASTKSAPLELLLECARLAALFSKAKNATHVDVVYTRVKHLRRVKNSIAQVLPSHTKTLHVHLDKEKTHGFLSMHETR